MLEKIQKVNELHPDGISSIATVATLYDVHKLTIQRWYQKGKFPKPVKINNCRFFKNSDLLKFNENLEYS